MSKRKKSLTVYNTDRYVNIELLEKQKIEDYTKVSILNKEVIQKEMEALHKKSRRLNLINDTHYLLYDEPYIDDNFVELLMQHAGGISYYTEGTVPYYIIEYMANKSNSQVIYTIRPEFTDREINNIETTSMATQTVIDLPVVIPYTNPYDCMFSLHPLKVHIDKVHLSFPPLHDNEMTALTQKYYEKREDGLYHAKERERFNFIRYFKDSLSIWKMNIFLICENKESYLNCHVILSDIMDKRNPNRKKQRKEVKEGKEGVTIE